MTGDKSPLGVGAPLWANRDWVGRSLPVDTPSGQELAAYARVCNAVEGNTTFYATPPPATVARWRDATPPGFRFVFKLPREITHDRRLADAEGPLEAFLAALDPVADRSGPLLVQLPASFGPPELTRLTAFLERAAEQASGRWRFAVEVRHAAFHPGGTSERELNDRLHHLDVNRVMFDARPVFAGPRETDEEIDAFEKKPNLPLRAVATGSEPIVRFIGQTALDANPSFYRPWVDRVVRWIDQGRRPVVFLHTPDNVVSLELCRMFHAEVVAQSGIVGLSEPPPTRAPPRLDLDAPSAETAQQSARGTLRS